MKNIVIYSFFIAVSCLFSCKNNSSEQLVINDEHSDEIFIEQAIFESNGMGFVSPEKIDFETTINCTGKIDVPPENKAVVSAIMGGFIRKTPYLVGDHVKKGQALIVIENPEFIRLQQQFLEANAKESFLLSEFERQKTLQEENINSLKQLKQAESDYLQAKAQKNGLAEMLQMLNIDIQTVLKGEVVSKVPVFSPINGVISKVHVNQGSYVDVAKPILEIIDNEHMHLELDVFEKDIISLKIGQKINFKLPETSTNYFAAHVFLIGNTIDNTKRTANVHAHFDEDEFHFAVGMFVEAEIVLESHSKWAVNRKALLKSTDSNYLLKLIALKDSVYHFEKIDLVSFDDEKEFIHFNGIEQDTSAKFLIGAYHLGEASPHSH